MATTPIYGFVTPDLGNTADGPAAFSALALAVEAQLAETTLTSWTPVLTSNGTVQPSTGITVAGSYRVKNGICDFVMQMLFGSGVAAGNGAYFVSLPVKARASLAQHYGIGCLTYVPSSGAYKGICRIVANQQLMTPHFNLTATDARVAPWQSAVSPASTIGTGVPAIPGNYTVANGGEFFAAGSYFV